MANWLSHKSLAWQWHMQWLHSLLGAWHWHIETSTSFVSDSVPTRLMDSLHVLLNSSRQWCMPKLPHKISQGDWTTYSANGNLQPIGASTLSVFIPVVSQCDYFAVTFCFMDEYRVGLALRLKVHGAFLCVSYGWWYLIGTIYKKTVKATIYICGRNMTKFNQGS